MIPCRTIRLELWPIKIQLWRISKIPACTRLSPNARLISRASIRPKSGKRLVFVGHIASTVIRRQAIVLVWSKHNCVVKFSFVFECQNSNLEVLKGTFLKIRKTHYAHWPQIYTTYNTNAAQSWANVYDVSPILTRHHANVAPCQVNSASVFSAPDAVGIGWSRPLSVGSAGGGRGGTFRHRFSIMKFTLENWARVFPAFQVVPGGCFESTVRINTENLAPGSPLLLVLWNRRSPVLQTRIRISIKDYLVWGSFIPCRNLKWSVVFLVLEFNQDSESEKAFKFK